MTAFFLTASACLAADMYHTDWIDFNKNGQKDVYEDVSAETDARIDDLLSQMTMDEKTKQVTLTLDAGRDLKMMNLDNEWVVEPGLFEFTIADSYNDDDTQLSEVIVLNDNGRWDSSSVQSLDIVELVAKPRFQMGYPPKHVLDSDRESRWSTNEKDPALTFLCREEFNQIGFVWYEGAARDYPFEVLVSDDLKTWTEIYRGTGGKTRFADLHDLPLVSNKYIRVQFHGNSENEFTSMYKVIFTNKIQL